MHDDYDEPKILLRHKMVAVFWMVVANAVIIGLGYVAISVTNSFFGFRIEQWNHLATGVLVGLAAWAIVYLIDHNGRHARELDRLRRQIDRLEREASENYTELVELRAEVSARLPPRLPQAR